MSPENATALAAFMERRAKRLAQAEATALVLAELAELDGRESADYNRQAKLELLRLHDIGGIRLRDPEHFGEAVANRLDHLVRRRTSRLHEIVNPSTSLAEIGAAELRTVTSALKNLGLILGEQGRETDPHFHNRSHP